MTTIQPELAAGDDDFVTEILTRRKRRLPILTAILVLAVAAGGAFIAGAEVQKHYGKSTTAGTGGASAFSALASRFRSGTAGAGAGAGAGTGRGGFFGAGGAGGGTTGTVTLIKGSTLYVTNSSGTTVLVHTSPASRVTKSVTGSVQTIHPGDTVTVTGAQAANGSYTAAAISIGGGASG
jgi:hypothetical protein